MPHPDNMFSIRALLLAAIKQLQKSTQTPQLDAELLLAYLLQVTREYVISYPEQTLTVLQQQQFSQLIARRVAGEPVAYILGRKEFWLLDLQVTSATLIPRPETELLVELALQNLPKDVSINVADLGTGSGAIALALAKECSQWQLAATDKSKAALAIAKLNAAQLQIHNIAFYAGDWCTALPMKQRFAAIISNPPYIDADDVHLQQPELQFEPNTALVAAENGLSDIRNIIAQACHYLTKGGLLLLEHGYDQAMMVRELLARAGYSAIASYCDGAGIERVTGARWQGAIPNPSFVRDY